VGNTNLYIGPYITVDVELAKEIKDACKNPDEYPNLDADMGFPNAA